MAVNLKEKNFTTLVLVVIVGILIGSYFNTLLGMILPGEGNVVKTIFTANIIKFGIGYPNPILINLDAIKFQFGIEMKFTALSVLGVFLSLYFFRWYR